MSDTSGLDPEITAIGQVYLALKSLESGAQARVLDYVAKKLGVELSEFKVPDRLAGEERSQTRHLDAVEEPRDPSVHLDKDTEEDSLEGVSTVARKWMRRSSLSTEQLSSFFSLGIEEIDLVAKSVPGETKKERMRSIFLLQGIAAYLGSGVARFAHDKVKEACLHYDAFDNTNFAKYYRDFSSEVSGSKDSDYNLSARGIASATELIKQMSAKT